MADQNDILRDSPGIFKAQCIVDACKPWNRNGIFLFLEAESKYTLRIDPPAKWRDLRAECGPEGYASARLRIWEPAVVEISNPLDRQAFWTAYGRRRRYCRELALVLEPCLLPVEPQQARLTEIPCHRTVSED